MENTLSQTITNNIYVVRGKKVLIDAYLAGLYGVPTKALNQAVKRNSNRFPVDFMFQLSENEWFGLRSQFVTSNLESEVGGRRYLPYVFTEQGVAMLSGILKSEQAINVNILIMRAFVKMRAVLESYNALLYRLDKVEDKIPEIEARQDELYSLIEQFFSREYNNRPSIGFKTENDSL